MRIAINRKAFMFFWQTGMSNRIEALRHRSSVAECSTCVYSAAISSFIVGIRRMDAIITHSQHSILISTETLILVFISLHLIRKTHFSSHYYVGYSVLKVERV